MRKRSRIRRMIRRMVRAGARKRKGFVKLMNSIRIHRGGYSM